MSSQDEFEELSDLLDNRFCRASFKVSMFESIDEMENKVITYLHDTIILAYYHKLKSYNHADIKLQDYFYFIIHKHEDEPYLRYCDVIDAIISLEIAGEVTPTRCLYLEDLQLTHKSKSSESTPMYITRWGS